MVRVGVVGKGMGEVVYGQSLAVRRTRHAHTTRRPGVVRMCKD